MAIGPNLCYDGCMDRKKNKFMDKIHMGILHHDLGKALYKLKKKRDKKRAKKTEERGERVSDYERMRGMHK